MGNLPANQKHGCKHLSQEREAHREWIGGRVLTLLRHYWREDEPAQLTAAIGADWAEVLEGLPREAIQRACVEYLRSNTYKPKPGDIYKLARSYMPRPQIVRQEPEQSQPPVTAEAAREILQRAGYRVNKFGGIE